MATNCSKCNNCKNECSCIPKGVTTPNYCLSDTSPCPEPAPCTETFDSQCVIYTGDGNECIGIENGQTVEEIIDILANKIQPLICLGCITTTIPSNTDINIELNQVLSWAPVANATGYDVYFSTNSTDVENSLPAALVSSNQISTNYNPSGPLTPDTTYYWKVIPINAAGSATNCLTYAFTTESTCVNPLVEVFNTILEVIPTSGDPEDLLKEIGVEIADILNNGFVLGKSCGACCPDCITGRYVLAGVQSFGEYYSTIYAKQELPTAARVMAVAPTGSPCCIEITSTYSNYTNLQKIFSEIPPTGECSCDSNYEVCLEQLKDLFQPQVWLDFLETGIVEESTLGGYTSLCAVKDFITSLPAILSQAQKAEILSDILRTGIVVECSDAGIIITSVESYIGGGFGVPA